MKEAVRRVKQLVTVPGRIVVILDFDGTLAPISPDPTAPQLVPAARPVLHRLARFAGEHPDRLDLVILSGRGAQDVANRVRLGGVTYLGDHGLEAGHLPPGVRAEYLHVETDPRYARHATVARHLGAEVVLMLGNPGWLDLEPKGPSFAFHYRRAPKPEAARSAIVAALEKAAIALEPELRKLAFARLEGWRIFEIRPADAGAKGQAAFRLLQRIRPAAAIAMGDDRTDAEALAMLRRVRAAGALQAAVAIGVHGVQDMPPELVAAADVILPGPAASVTVLRALAKALESEAGGAKAPRSGAQTRA